MEGPLIVLEGVDGAGTTTQSRLLTAALRASRRPVHGTQEPSIGPVGSLLRQALNGRLVMPGVAGGRPPSWRTMALLFAADRIDHLDVEILPNLRDGLHVVCDRYYHSSIAYQSLTGGGEEAIPWLLEINRHARRPDLTIVLDVSPEVAAGRRDERGASEIFDEQSLQVRLGRFYRDLSLHFPGERIVHVNADAPVEQVSAAVLDHVQGL